jgi:hypothetical protein
MSSRSRRLFLPRPVADPENSFSRARTPKRPTPVVVKAIARASVWFEQLITGKSQSMAEIAVHENITDNYVSNLIDLAWLSPDIVDRVLEGDLEETAREGRHALAQIRCLWGRR